MKKIFNLFLVLLVCISFNSCGALMHSTVNLSNGHGTRYVTEWNSYGNYNIKGKTFYIVSANNSVSSHDLEFKEFAQLIETSLVYSGAIKANNNQTADMCILMDYGISDESYIADIPVPIWGQTGISSIKTTTNTRANVSGSAYAIGNSVYGNAYGNSKTTSTTTVTPTYGVTGYTTVSRKVSEFYRYINLYAYDNMNRENSEMIWKINAYSTGSSDQLRKIMPYMAYSLRFEYGKSSKETEGEVVFESDYMYELYYEGYLNQPNVVVWPECQSNTKHQYGDFKVAFVDKRADKTYVCLIKTGGGYGLWYAFGPRIVLNTNGKEYEGYCSQYTLGEKIWNESGTRYFMFEFPVNISNAYNVDIYETDKKGKKQGFVWSNIRVK